MLTTLVLVAAGCGGSGGGDEVALCVSSPGNDKYCLVEDPAGGGGGLKRVRALRDITALENGQPVLVAQRGDLGGWVEGEENLSVEGSAWVAGDAKVFGGARVEGDALVTGLAEVSDGAAVRDRAAVSGQARVFGGAKVYGEAVVGGNAIVCQNAHTYGHSRVTGNSIVCGTPARQFVLGARSQLMVYPDVMRLERWVRGWTETVHEVVLDKFRSIKMGPHVFDRAEVVGSATILDSPSIFGTARVSDDALVYGNAQVFGDTRIYDQSQVYGNAMIFGHSDAQYRVNWTETEGNVFADVFDKDDVARRVWTNSDYDPHQWSYPRSVVAQFTFLDGGSLIPYGKWLPSDTDVLGHPRPTEVFGRSRVFGNTRVWGGSHIFGNAVIAEEVRVSGASKKDGGRLCGSMWINSTKHGGTVECFN